MQTPSEQIKPSRKWYVLALCITLLGPIIGIISILHILHLPPEVKITTQQAVSDSYTFWEIEKFQQYPWGTLKLNFVMIFLALIIGPLLAIGVLIARNSAIRDEPVSKIAPEDVSANNALAAFCHGSGFTLFLYPFGHIISPLFIWLFFKDQYPAVNEHGKSVLNFQLSMTLYYLLIIPFVFLLIGIPLLILLGLYHLFIMIIGIATAAQGKSFRYPLSLKLIS